MIEIIDNFLTDEEYNYLQDHLIGNGYPNEGRSIIPWYYNDAIDGPSFVEKNKQTYQFCHTFISFGEIQSYWFESVKVPLSKILGNCYDVLRIKANLVPRTQEIIENSFHTDFASPFIDENYITSIFYVNTNNGYTLFEDGTKIDSIKNRLIKFPATLKHTGTTCTDEKIRVVINFNYEPGE